jgi:hypothetical protein
MAADGPIRRMIVVLMVFLPIGVAASIWRGDSAGTTVGHALVGLAVCGFLVGCYLYASRPRR